MLGRNRFIRFLSGGALLVASACLPASAAVPNVLANPGFETGTANGNGDVGGAPSWTTFGNVYNVSAPNPVPVGPHTGTGALKEFGTFPGVSGAFQTFPTTPGTAWSLSGFGLNSTSDPMQTGNFGEVKISFQNAANTELLGIDSNHIDTTTLPDVWTLLQASGVAPAGTDHVNLFALFVQPQFAGGSTFFDDLSGSVVPEPASIGLFGIAGLAVLRRRRCAALPAK